MSIREMKKGFIKEKIDERECVQAEEFIDPMWEKKKSK